MTSLYAFPRIRYLLITPIESKTNLFIPNIKNSQPFAVNNLILVLQQNSIVAGAKLSEKNGFEKALLSFYNASYGGKYGLVGSIENLEELVQKGYVQVAKCCNDPLSTHGAKTCRVLIARLTKEGISNGAEAVLNQMNGFRGSGIWDNPAVKFIYSLKALPPKVQRLYRFLFKNWLQACEKGQVFTWENSLSLPFPAEVKQLITETNQKLVEDGLAARAYLGHITSGPSDPSLMTCPEIHDFLLEREAGELKTTTIDEYLNYMLNGLKVYEAKDMLLHCLNTRQYSYTSPEGYPDGIIKEELWSWLRKLEEGGYVSICTKGTEHGLNGDTNKSREMHSTRANLEVIARYSRLNPKTEVFDPVRQIREEVKLKLQKWFETGEEQFQRFEIEID